MADEINVMKEIESMEAAQEEYQREKNTVGIHEALTRAMPTQVQSTLLQIKDRAGRMSRSNTARFQDMADSVVKDTDIPNDSIQPMFEKLLEAFSKETQADIECIEKAYERAIRTLRKRSNPFDGETHTNSFSRYVSELSLLGGPGESPSEIVKTANDALDQDDKGALQFWSKNLEKLLERRPGDKSKAMRADDIKRVRQLRSRLDDEMKSSRNALQRIEHQKLTVLKQEWSDMNMDQELRLGRMSASRTVDSLKKSRTIKPRKRTAEENTLAEHKEDRRRVEADYHRLRGRA